MDGLGGGAVRFFVCGRKPGGIRSPRCSVSGAARPVRGDGDGHGSLVDRRANPCHLAVEAPGDRDLWPLSCGDGGARHGRSLAAGSWGACGTRFRGRVRGSMLLGLATIPRKPNVRPCTSGEARTAGNLRFPPALALSAPAHARLEHPPCTRVESSHSQRSTRTPARQYKVLARDGLRCKSLACDIARQGGRKWYMISRRRRRGLGVATIGARRRMPRAAPTKRHPTPTTRIWARRSFHGCSGWKRQHCHRDAAPGAVNKGPSIPDLEIRGRHLPRHWYER